MPDNNIFTDSDEAVRVIHDTGDANLPIAVATDDGVQAWLRPDEARNLANAVLAALGGGSGPITPASSISYNEGALRLAAVHGATVRFSYAKGDGSVIESRRLVPETVSETRGHLRFVGFDPDREDFRAYRVDRIKGTVEVQA